jgi:hypothetical protein
MKNQAHGTRRTGKINAYMMPLGVIFQASGRTFFSRRRVFALSSCNAEGPHGLTPTFVRLLQIYLGFFFLIFRQD